MSKTIAIVLGSVREGRAADKIADEVKKELESQGINTIIVDFKQSPLPFVDSPVPPSTEGYEPNHESVKNWQKMVQDVDGLIMISPEYNGQISAVLKNSIDWLFADWKNKPVAIVSYGWNGAIDSAALLEKLMTKIGATVADEKAQLYFTKDINVDGSALDIFTVQNKLKDTIESLVKITN